MRRSAIEYSGAMQHRRNSSGFCVEIAHFVESAPVGTLAFGKRFGMHEPVDFFMIVVFDEILVIQGSKFLSGDSFPFVFELVNLLF